TRGIKVNNPTPYYFSFDSAIAYSGDTQYPLVADMIPPFGNKEFALADKNKVPATIGSVEVRLINDYGGVVKYQLTHSTGNTLSIKK
ncbi:pilus assembly protein, partial [Raoultella ornithinolytica]